MSDKTVDLRSDTITLPTEEMREAMAQASLGDDVYGEDPTVNKLQELAAEKVGMEAALYVPSGTMGNTCALLAHSNPGDEALFEEQAHMYYWEAGAYDPKCPLHKIWRPNLLSRTRWTEPAEPDGPTATTRMHDVRGWFRSPVRCTVRSKIRSDQISGDQRRSDQMRY